MPRWTEENRVWGDLVDGIKSMQVDEMIVQETDQVRTCQATGRYAAIKAGVKVHTFKTKDKVYFVRTA